MRAEKKLLLDEIMEGFNNSSAFIIAKHNGLKPEESWKFSELLGKNKSRFMVVKKRLLKLAVKDMDMDLSGLSGHAGVVFIDGDAMESLKTVVDFRKSVEDKLEIITGQLEGKFYSSEDFEKLATLPSKDQMRAEIVGLLEAPMAQTLSVIKSLLTAVIHCLENKKAKG